MIICLSMNATTDNFMKNDIIPAKKVKTDELYNNNTIAAVEEVGVITITNNVSIVEEKCLQTVIETKIFPFYLNIMLSFHFN